MEQQKNSASLVLPVGLMLFSFFFGAGNLIFPPVLGQAAGDNLWSAVWGFCVSGVGMPLLGVLAIVINNYVNSYEMALPVQSTYAKVVMILCALTIGPFFAAPRTAAVSYETGIQFFLAPSMHDLGMLIYSVLFFALTYYLCVNPSDLVDNIGKILTPLLLLSLALLIVFAVVKPMGNAGAAVEAYRSAPYFKGLLEGYNTMDLLAAMLFGPATIQAIKLKGITDQKVLGKVCIYAGLVAAACLAVVYASLAYIGATSVNQLGLETNGGKLLNMISTYYFGEFGLVVLTLIIFFACITTSVGLCTSISSYFEILADGKITYRQFVIGMCLFSLCVSNIGLSNIIKFSIPVLCMLYPVIVVLVLLNCGNRIFNRDKMIYRCCMIPTTIFAVFDGLRAAGIDTGVVNAFLSKTVPLYDIGFGWIVPAVIGIAVGYILRVVFKSGK
ncbi:MAG: branched-chain amino acid transport system II carrier protein [Acidaminococcaceae bacterium]|nr:branched-chain amino acid transport system II carrier protein [Acidaminococcaceae bacterium]